MGESRDLEGRPRTAWSCSETCSIQLLRRLVTRKHEALELFHVLVPQIRSLAIERTRAITHHVSISHQLTQQRAYSLVRLSQQTLQAQQHGANVVHGAPLVLQDVEADPAAEVDVGVVNWRLEEDRRRGVGVRGAELHAELEDEVLVGCGGGAVDGGGPAGHVLVVREGSDAGSGLHHDVHELLLESVWCRS